MPICNICDFRVPVVAECGGERCEQAVCGACMTADGLCDDCDRERAKGETCPPMADELIAILLSGATIGGERMPAVASGDADHA